MCDAYISNYISIDRQDLVPYACESMPKIIPSLLLVKIIILLHILCTAFSNQPEFILVDVFEVDKYIVIAVIIVVNRTTIIVILIAITSLFNIYPADDNMLHICTLTNISFPRAIPRHTSKNNMREGGMNLSQSAGWLMSSTMLYTKSTI